jgi:hypothetical protein
MRHINGLAPGNDGTSQEHLLNTEEENWRKDRKKKDNHNISKNPIIYFLFIVANM